MDVRIDHYIHFAHSVPDPRIDQILNLLETVMTDQAQTKAILEEISTNLTEASGELTSKIDELTAAIAAAGQNTPEVDALLEALRTQSRALADVVPNPAPPVEPQS